MIDVQKSTMLSQQTRRFVQIAALQFFVSTAIARVLHQMEPQFQTDPDPRYGSGPVITPIKYLSISRLKNNQNSNTGVHGSLSSEYLQERDVAPKQIRIELGRGTNRRVSIKTQGSSRKIHLRLGGRQHHSESSPRRVHLRFTSRNKNMDAPSQMITRDNNYSPANGATQTFQRSSTVDNRPQQQMVILRNSQNQAPKRVVFKTGSGSSNGRVVRIHLAGSRKRIIIQRGATRGHIADSGRPEFQNTEQYSKFTHNSAANHVVPASSAIQGQALLQESTTSVPVNNMDIEEPEFLTTQGNIQNTDKSFDQSKASLIMQAIKNILSNDIAL